MKKLFLALCLLISLIFCLTLVNQMSNEVSAMENQRLTVNKNGNEFILTTDKFGEIVRSTNEIKNKKLIQLPKSNALVIIWDENFGGEDQVDKIIHKYAISSDGSKINVVKDVSYDLLLRFAKFDPLVSTPAIPESLINKKLEGDEATYIVQFVSQPLDEYHSSIAALGAKRYTYLANHSYLVIMNGETRSKVEDLPFVRWVGNYQPAYKLEEFLLDGLNRENLARMRYNIMLLDRGLEMQNKISNKINSLGGKIELKIPEGFRLEATLTPEQLTELTQENEILFIDRWSAPETDMSLVRNVGGANFVENTLGYSGQGVRAEVLDSGILKTHTDFNSALPVLEHGLNDVSSHGTSTYGINFGTGFTDPAGRGMLPGAQGIFADYGSLTNRYTHTAELKQAPYFAVFQSNSWGSSLTTAYTTVSAEMDDILFQNDIVVLNSQSNAGTQSSRPQAWAKNVVSIGGIRHFNTETFDDDRWQNGASTGPASDGRIKPDLAHFYDGIFTQTSTNATAYTTSFGGTSAATPITAGHFGIFFQMWHNGIFGNPTRATVFDSAPHMTTAKAIMINNAVPWSLDAPSDATRARQGWGRANVEQLYRNRRDMLIIDESHVLTNLQSRTYNINITSSVKPLKATLVFADPMGNPASPQSRINNLSLKVTAPNGTVYWGNNGMLTSPWTAPGGTENPVDTVENVFIASPALGVWVVEVIASELVQDARLETPGVIDADYALVVGYSQFRTAQFDYDADGKTDVSIWRPSNGVWYMQNSTAGFYAVAFGQNGDKVVPADFSGDGRTDVAVFRPSDNTWYVFNTANNTFYAVPFGTAGDIPVPEDFDGDGKADINVFRPSTGVWFRTNSSNGQFVATPFGQNGDVPTVGDYDGDGKADIAVWRSTNGGWYRLNSNNNSFFAVAFGQAGDKVVPADYTGDGKTDIAVYRAGTWFILRSEDLSFYGIPFGLATDVPSPGDYDGDGKADQAVYRNGQWFVLASQNGFLSIPFGLTSDIPTPSAFVY